MSVDSITIGIKGTIGGPRLLHVTRSVDGFIRWPGDAPLADEFTIRADEADAVVAAIRAGQAAVGTQLTGDIQGRWRPSSPDLGEAAPAAAKPASAPEISRIIIVHGWGDNPPEYEAVGFNGVTRITKKYYPGPGVGQLPYLQVWAADHLVAEYAQHMIIGVVYGLPRE